MFVKVFEWVKEFVMCCDKQCTGEKVNSIAYKLGSSDSV